jgi:hypothetical protein
MTVARSRDVDIFDTSAGWKLKNPRSNHDLEPLISTPRKITATSKNRTIRYIGKDKPSYIRGFIKNRITAANPSAVIIQMNCIPLRQFVSKIDVGSSVCTDA